MAGVPRPIAHRNRAIVDTEKEIVRLLKIALQRIREQLDNQPTDYQRWALPQLRAQLEAILAEFEGRASPAATAGQVKAWEAAVESVDEIVSRTAGPTVVAVVPQVDQTALRAMQTFMTDRIKDVSLEVVRKINTELGLVILGAQSPSEAIGKLAKIFDGQRQRAITIVRTEVGRAFSVAGQARLEQMAPRVPGLKKQWRRSGKIHSRPGHDAIDGQVRAIDEPFEVITPRGEIVTLMHPRDPSAPPGETINCGCESLPFMDRWAVKNPDRKPFTDAELTPAELKRNPVKAAFVRNRKKPSK
ncbi:MAG: hypothetical protein GC151_13895 [Betaproteobacteria bacterium]|nr:hypothetical protein [Betaproteobacteria bacterium]